MRPTALRQAPSPHDGFTLIELMVVVSTIAVLAALAFPSYSAYITRSKMVEGVNLAHACMTALDTYAADHPDDLTDSAGNAVCDTTVLKTENFITQPISVQSGTVVIIRIQLSPSFGGSLSNTQFGWWKDYAQSSPRWVCGGTLWVNTSPILEASLPSSCHG